MSNGYYVYVSCQEERNQQCSACLGVRVFKGIHVWENNQTYIGSLTQYL